MSFPLATGTPWDQMWSLISPALVATLEMVAITTAIMVAAGIPLALLLHNTSPDGLRPQPVVHQALGWVVNVAWSLPFVIVMVALIPLTRSLTGTTIGVWAAVVPLSIVMTCYFARLAEVALRDVRPEVIDIARASGGSRFQTMWRVQLLEAVPGIISNLTLAMVGVVSYTAIAGAVGAGGIGYLAISYGYNQFDNNVMLACVIVLVAIVQVIQLGGNFAARISRHR